MESTEKKHPSAWRGSPFTDAQLAQGFDLEKLLGKPVFLSIQHATREGTTFANVVALMPLPKGQPAPIPDPGYVRVCDRSNGGGTRHGHPEGADDPEDEEPREDAQEPENDDDDIPF